MYQPFTDMIAREKERDLDRAFRRAALARRAVKEPKPGRLAAAMTSALRRRGDRRDLARLDVAGRDACSEVIARATSSTASA